MILRKKNVSKKIFREKKNVIEKSSINVLCSGSFAPGSWEAPTPGLRHFMIESPFPTGYRVSLISVSESGSQKSLSQKLKIKILLNENVKKK